MTNSLKMPKKVVLIAVIGFALTFMSCDTFNNIFNNDRNHMAYDVFGTWRTTGSDWWQIEVSAERYILTYQNGNMVIVDKLTWEEVLNDGTQTRNPSDYQRGFVVTGNISRNTGITGNVFDRGQTGILITCYIYINNSKTRLFYSPFRNVVNNVFHKR
jgi:hypothetical protein